MMIWFNAILILFNLKCLNVKTLISFFLDFEFWTDDVYDVYRIATKYSSFENIYHFVLFQIFKLIMVYLRAMYAPYE